MTPLTELCIVGNPWTAAIHSVAVLVVFRILLTAMDFALFCWAFYKLVKFILVQGSAFNVPQVCLALEVLASLCKFPKQTRSES